MDGPTSGPVVLIAEDLTIVRRPIALYLKRRGFRVIEVQNGEEVLEAVAEGPVDAMLLDLHMPLLDGFEVLERLGGRGKVPPTIVYTSHPLTENVERALSLGAEEVVVKGSQTLKGLIGRLQDLIAKHRRDAAA